MKYVVSKFFLLKCGNDVVLVWVSLVNDPGSVAIPTVNSLALVIPVTWKVPLNPELPAPVVFMPLTTLISSTLESTERSCGNSVKTFATFDAQWACAINLKFLCSFSWFNDPDPKYVWTSESVDPIEVFDSCKINPSLGGLAFAPPLDAGITYLNL